MKNFALLVAFALLAFAVPTSATEISQATLATTLDRQIEGTVFSPAPPLLEYCSAVNGTSCTTLGAKRSCTDSCSNQLSCTCTYTYGTPSQWYWYCDWEC